MKINKVSESFFKKLKEFRHTIHQHPELSGKENDTARRIREFISTAGPDEIITEIGGTGLAAIFNGQESGPTVMIRAELDALPIKEKNDLEYKSTDENVSHKCGHDGHMTMVAGLGELLKENPPERGRVILFFQPAEETGEGAYRVLRDEKFKALKPDFIFALHNLPKFPLKSIIVKENVFASASRGMTIRFKGETSHAAHPENGKNPAFAMANILLDMRRLNNDHAEKFRSFILITPVHSELGEIAFGTSAGDGVLRATLRSYLDEDMEELISILESTIREECEKEGIGFDISYSEIFPSTVNDEEGNKVILKAVDSLGLEKINNEEPFKWSEDFGHYTEQFKGGFFGLGSGKDQPQLHNADYDFPDELLPVGINMFDRIIREILGPG